MSIHQYEPHLKAFSRELRKNQTSAERILWHFLRKKQVLNIRFCRQKPLGPYIVDFYAKEVNLVIELDGIQHYDEQHIIYDKHRDDYLRSLGLSILRFNNIEVTRCVESILNIVESHIQEKPYTTQYGGYMIPW